MVEYVGLETEHSRGAAGEVVETRIRAAPGYNLVGVILRPPILQGQYSVIVRPAGDGAAAGATDKAGEAAHGSQ
jgi:hypothetical protein